MQELMYPYPNTGIEEYTILGTWVKKPSAVLLKSGVKMDAQDYIILKTKRDMETKGAP